MIRSEVKRINQVVNSYIKNIDNIAIPREKFSIDTVKVRSIDRVIYYSSVQSSDESSTDLICQCVFDNNKLEMSGILKHQNDDFVLIDDMYVRSPIKSINFVVSAQVMDNVLLVESVFGSKRDFNKFPVSSNYSIKMGLDRVDSNQKTLSYK